MGKLACIVLLFLAAQGCSDSPLASVTGSWGGAYGFRIEASRNTTSMHYACSQVAAGPLRPDAQGRFAILGRTSGLNVSPATVTVAGRVSGDTLFAGVFEGAVPDSLPGLPFGLANAATDYSGFMCTQ